MGLIIQHEKNCLKPFMKLIVTKSFTSFLYFVIYNVLWILLFKGIPFDNEKLPTCFCCSSQNTMMSDKRGVGCISMEMGCYFKNIKYSPDCIRVRIRKIYFIYYRNYFWTTKMKSQFYKIIVLKNGGLFHFYKKFILKYIKRRSILLIRGIVNDQQI